MNPTPRSEPTMERLLAEQAWVRRVAGALVHDADRSDDLTQDVYLAALDRAPAALESPRAWLGTVLRNRARNLRRAETRRTRRERAYTSPEAEPAPPDVVERAELVQRVARLALELDEPYRTTILLRYLEDQSPPAVARHMDVPLETVRTRLRRGLATLRARLDAEHHGDRRSWILALAPLMLPPSSAGVAGAAAGVILVKKMLIAFLVLAVAVAIWGWLGHRSDPVTQRYGASQEAADLVPPTLEGRGATAEIESHKADVDTPGSPAAGSSITYTGRVVGPEGRGVAGAIVSLCWWSAEPADGGGGYGFHLVIRRERERREAPRTRTDKNGYFRFERPYSGRVWFGVEADGFAAAVAGPAVAASETTIALSREGTLLVRVRDTAGRPVPDARVRLVTRIHTLGLSPQARRVLTRSRTDSEGAARLPRAPERGLGLEVDSTNPTHGFVERPLSADEEVVEVTVPGVKVVERRIVDAVTGAPVPEAYVSVLASDLGVKSAEFDVLRRRFPADRDGVVRFPHQAEYYAEYATAPGYEVVHAWEDPIRLPRAMRIEGTVRTDVGTPVAGAALLLVGGGATALDGVLVGETGTAGWSDESGRFEVDVKLPHGFGVTSRAEGRLRSLVALHPDHAPAIEDRIEVTPGGRTVVDLVVPAPATLVVEVIDAEGNACADEWLGVARKIPRPEEAAAPRHPLEDHFDPLHLLRGGTWQTDAEGRCVVEGLCPGRWIVYTQFASRSLPVDVAAGERRVVRLEKSGRLQITGRVLNFDGTPYRGQVNLQGPRPGMVRTDDDGRFAFPDLEPGDYRIWILTATVAEGRRLDYERAVRAGEQVEIRLPAPARLRLRVEGPPADTVEYTLQTLTGGFDPHETGFAAWDPDSGLTNPFTPGPGLLLVRATGFGWTAVRFDATPGDTTDVAVTMRPAGTVRGRLVDARPTKGWFVRLKPLDDVVERLTVDAEKLRYLVGRAMGSINGHAFPDEEGLFAADDVPAGTYEVSYGHYDVGAYTWVGGPPVQIDVRSGETTTCELSPP